jgi:hypothetical protein
MTTAHYFPNKGFLEVKLQEEDLVTLKNEVAEIQNDPSNIEKFNTALAGNIKREYKITKSHNDIERLVLPYVNAYVREYFKTEENLKLDSVWVNFQEKYEFNPLHWHIGMYSFVLWLKIPYNIEDELANGPGNSSLNNLAGTFQFMFFDSMGTIRPYNIYADKKYENTLIVFPAALFHCVHPFYTSDEYRISVSGNFILT